MRARTLQVRVYEAGQDLMVEGCPAESFFMVEEGSLELTRRRFKARSVCVCGRLWVCDLVVRIRNLKGSID